MHIRQTDVFARLGGDEFGIVMYGARVDDAKRLLHTVLEALADWPFEWDDRVFAVGASIGVVPVSSESGSVDRVLAAADSAC
ncbi:MAG: diguanylate cyclase [Acidimicrobiales bacterium]